jgi:UDP-N-acetylmuramate-alanine ligase
LPTFHAKYRIVGNTNVDHADQYTYWSKAARKAKTTKHKQAYGQYLRVEHGTPRRQFARDVLKPSKSKTIKEMDG